MSTRRAIPEIPLPGSAHRPRGCHRRQSLHLHSNGALIEMPALFLTAHNPVSLHRRSTSLPACMMDAAGPHPVAPSLEGVGGQIDATCAGVVEHARPVRRFT